MTLYSPRYSDECLPLLGANKMAAGSRFAKSSYEEISESKINQVPKTMQNATSI